MYKYADPRVKIYVPFDFAGDLNENSGRSPTRVHPCWGIYHQLGSCKRLSKLFGPTGSLRQIKRPKGKVT